MTRRIVRVLLLAASVSGGATAADDDGMARVAASCPAAAAWISAHRVQPPNGGEDDHAFSEPALRTALQQRKARDQQVRDAWVAAGMRLESKQTKVMHEADASNTAWLKGVIDHSGFPTPEQVGKQGVNDAWLLVQHAEADPGFQSRVLAMLEPCVHDGTIRASDYAMLDDRVRINQGKPQRYGSQFAGDAAKPGEMHLSPVEDPAHLDERRARMGLMPMRDYECALRATYAVSSAPQ